MAGARNGNAEIGPTRDFNGLLREIAAWRGHPNGHWAAELVCGHSRWVPQGPPDGPEAPAHEPDVRPARLGSVLECDACERRERPDSLAPYRRTPEFDEASIPKGLLKEHRTKQGVWAVINVTSGQLRYADRDPAFNDVLGPGDALSVPPEHPHSVTALGRVRFYVEFWRKRTRIECP